MYLGDFADVSKAPSVFLFSPNLHIPTILTHLTHFDLDNGGRIYFRNVGSIAPFQIS
jgi:hypothetical protein